MWGNIAIIFLLAVITSWAVTPLTIKLAKKIGAVDIPKDERKIHSKPMPRLGGLAIVIGFFVSVFLVLFISDTLRIGMSDNLVGFFLGAVVISAFCFIDDLKNINPWVKLLGQVIAAICVVSKGIIIEHVSIPFFNIGEIPHWCSIVLTIGWIVGVTNAINLIDGLDGLSAGISGISTISLLLIFTLNESPLISILLITALSGAILGFLPFNFNPAKTFLGDTGSNFIGYCLATISILGIAKTYTMLVIVLPMLVLGIPIFDTLFAIIRRLRKGKSVKAIVTADRGHLHHILMDLGFSQKQAVIILYCITAFLGLISVVLMDIDASYGKIILFGAIFLIIGVFALINIIKNRKDLLENANNSCEQYEIIKEGDTAKVQITLVECITNEGILLLIKSLKELQTVKEIEFIIESKNKKEVRKISLNKELSNYEEIINELKSL